MQVLLIAALALLAGACRPAPSIPPDRIVPVARGPIIRGVVAVGRVEPRTRVEVKSRANGILQKLHVDVNEPVRAGQVIAELDREILEARVAEAEGSVRQARAALETARAEIARLETEKTDPEIRFAERRWERIQKLHQQGIASDDERDLAEQRLAQARYSIELIDVQLDTAAARLSAAEGRVQEVEATAELTRQELQEATITSPIDGVVLYRYVEEGDSVSSIRVAGGNATTLMTLGDLSDLYVDGEIDEVDVGRVLQRQREGGDLPVRITIESVPGRRFNGRVLRITPLGLEDSNGIVTFEVRIAVDNPENLLLANMTANAVIVLEEKPNVLQVPQGALLTRGPETFAQVLDGSGTDFETRPVRTGISDGRRVEIVEGLADGQSIVLP